jgi:hypothetical protein
LVQVEARHPRVARSPAAVVVLGARIQITVGEVVLRVVEECRLPDINLVVRALRDKGSLAETTVDLAIRPAVVAVLLWLVIPTVTAETANNPALPGPRPITREVVQGSVAVLLAVRVAEDREVRAQPTPAVAVLDFPAGPVVQAS